MSQRFETDFTFPFSYNKEGDCIAVEISCLPNFGDYRRNVTIVSTKTGKEVEFRFVGTDTDGEDIYGFNYVSCDPNIKTRLLIIND